MKCFASALAVLMCMFMMPPTHPQYRHVREKRSEEKEISLPAFTDVNEQIHFASSKTKIPVSIVSPFKVKQVISTGMAVRGIIGMSKSSRPVEAWYFPGTSGKRALIIGGMHGSELSSIEIAKELIRSLQNEDRRYYSVIVIPCLFPDNAIKAASNPALIGSVNNIGRYSHKDAVDPNRQMPELGSAFNAGDPHDHMGREIEMENQLLLDLIGEYRPHRMVNLHAIRDIKHAGIFADPRTDNKGIAIGYESDSSLAVDMAKEIYFNGGHVKGNQVDVIPVIRYHCDPPIASRGELQGRNLQGSKLPNGRGRGVSMGSWASTAVYDEANPANNRDAIRLITVEFPGYKRSQDYDSIEEQYQCRKNVELYTSSIMRIFLQNKYEEGVDG